MYYRHNMDIKYPERSDEHMITVKHLRDTNFDEHYQYLEKGLWHKIKRAALSVGLYLVGYHAATIRYGLKIHGRENLKKHKDLLKNGAITVCNHVLMWDYICVLKAIRPRLQYHPGWATNFEGPNAGFIRWVGGIPIPANNLRAMVKFNKAIEQVLESGTWLHFFPEGSMWFYYPDIRPLKKAVFKYSVKYNKPVVPITISFRPRKGLWKLLGNKPCADLHVGEPILPDTTLPMNDAIDKIHKETYHTMQVMNGINPGDPTYNENQNIDEYKKTM